MATKVGFDRAYLGLLDDNEQLVKTGDTALDSKTGVFVVDATTSKGVTTASITGLDPTQTKIYGSNVVTDISQKGSGAVVVTLGANDIPEVVLNKLYGMKQDSKTKAWFIDKDTVAPDAALLLVSDLLSNEPVYFALLKGKFVPSDVTLNTNNDQEQREADSIRFSGINRNSDGRIYESWLPDGSTAVSVDTILADVFPGYTASSN